MALPDMEDLLRQQLDVATTDVLTSVTIQCVLDEMVSDIETWVYESDIQALNNELNRMRNQVAQHAISERLHWDEKQNMLQQMELLQGQGKALAIQLKREVELVAHELDDKQRLEREYADCKEKMTAYATLAKELARSQREVRDLHRRQSIQSMLKRSPASSPTLPTRSITKGLLRLEDKQLLVIFSFVDASDVLSMSLTSHKWRSRINALFGLERESRTPHTPALPKVPITKPKPVPAMDRTQLAKADELLRSLSAKDVKVFHDIMLRMKSLEANLVSVQVEKEDLAARLHGAENVRDFLMEKLTDVEDALSLSIEEKEKADAQSILDREVMAYLDTKTQELEIVLESYAKQNEEYKIELNRIQYEQEAKTQVIEDMVRHLTMEKKELELQSKAQKKVLVKEVRMLRGETSKLKNECNGYRNQLKQLKESLLHLEHFH